jgi:hypothetical protein
MASPTVPMSSHEIDALIRTKPIKLRCDIVKHIVAEGDGAPLTRPHAHAIISYTLYVHDLSPESRQAAELRARNDPRRRTTSSSLDESDSTSTDADHDRVADYRYELLDERKSLTVTTGVTKIVPGLEIGLLSMREKERALIVVPASMGFPSGVRGRVTANRMLLFDVTVKTAFPVVRLNASTLKFTQKEGDGDMVDIDDTVTLMVIRVNPITQARKTEKLTCTLGTPESGPFDDAVLSMRTKELAVVFIDGVEVLIALSSAEKSHHPRPLRVKAGASLDSPQRGVGSSSAHSAPDVPLLRSLDVDPALARSHLESTLTPEQRLADVRRRRDIGRRLMGSNDHAKAAAVYRRASSVLLADPPLDRDPKFGAEARKEAAVLMTNCGRAQHILGQRELAVLSAATAVDMDPAYQKGQFLYGQVLRLSGRFEEAIKALNDCLQLLDAADQAVPASPGVPGAPQSGRAEVLAEKAQAEAQLAELKASTEASGAAAA